MKRAALVLLLPLLLSPAAAGTPPPAPTRFTPDPKLPADLGVPYVVITNDALAPSWQKLIEFKRAGGMPAQIVSTDWLMKTSSYPGVGLPDRLYALLKDLRLNWKTQWVLLGGDDDAVPTQRIRAFHGTFGGNQVACDVFYSDLLPKEYADAEAVEGYDWSSGGRFVGDVTKGEFDMIPELYVGRVPTETPAEVDAFLEKYFEYAYPTGKDAAWLTRALVVGANQFKDNQEKVSGLFKDLGGAGYSTELLVEKAPDAIQAITDEMNRGYAFFDFLCHGCPSHFWAKDDRTSWGVVQVRTLKNDGRYPVIFANSCDTAEFDKPNCLASTLLTVPKAGGVAYMGYTNVCFQSPVNQEIYRLLFAGGCPQLGRAMAEAKLKLDRDKWMVQILNLFGEPEMWVRTGAPIAIKTADERFSANVPGRVTVTDAAGKPIAGARVLLEGAGTYSVALTDEKGVAALPPPAKAGAARLAVLAQNGVKFEKKVAIDSKVPDGFSKAISRPAIAVDDSVDEAGEDALHGNGQKDLGPGETVKVVFSWPKDQAPPAGSWSLAIDDRFVSVTGPAVVADGTVSFPVRVTAKVPPWHQAWMALSFKEKEDGEAWTWNFRQPVEGPYVTCVAVGVDDADGNKDKRIGWEDAGKKVRFTVGLLNRGTKKANNLKVTIKTEDSSVTLAKDTVAFGGLACDELLQPKDKAFEFQLAADYDGHPLAFTMVIEDDRKSKWEGRVLFTVPPAPPMLLKADGALKSVALSWIAGGTPSVVGYHVYRGTSEKGPFTRLTEQPVKGGTRYPDNEVKPSSTYWYVVTSVTADGLESRHSTPAKGHTLTPLPKEKGVAK